MMTDNEIEITKADTAGCLGILIFISIVVIAFAAYGVYRLLT